MRTTIEEALAATIGDLTEAGIPDAVGDARRLMAFALDIAPDRLTLVQKDAITPAGLGALDSAIKARLERKPVSHILGVREFWGRPFKVTPDVLDPRPETETLIEAALAQPFTRVLDLGTGSGCILLTLLAERSNATGMGVDASQEALEVATENRTSLGLDRRAIFAASDWFARVVGTFDLIVANPPYIALPEMATLAPEVLRWEPMAALTPGLTGLEAYELIAQGIAPFLAPKGRVLLEIGPNQADAITEIFTRAGLRLEAVYKDMDGRDRVVGLQHSG